MKDQKQSLTAILLDDDSEQAYLMARMVAEIDTMNVELIHYSTTQKAMADLLIDRADVVFLDHYLGEDKTGLDLLRELRGHGFDGPVVMLTGCDQPEIIDSFLRFGADAYVDKADLDSARIAEAIQVALCEPHLQTPRVLTEKSQLKR